MSGPSSDSRTIVVLGSANLDLVVQVERQPQPGETVFGTGFATVPGGKGLNQAVAAARAGGRVRFVGAVGKDDFGTRLLALLRGEGIESSAVVRLDEPTGTAHINVTADGGNSIVVVSGANAGVRPEQLTGAVLLGAGWMVTQLELPLATVASAIEVAASAGLRTVLTPSPARQLSEDLLRQVDLLVPNQVEASQLTGRADPLAAARALSRTCADVVVTLGGDGSAWARDGEIVQRVDADKGPVVDTTGAGDTYVGVLVAGLAEGAGMGEAMRRASLAAAIAVRRPGASVSMPTRAEVDLFIRSSRPGGI